MDTDISFLLPMVEFQITNHWHQCDIQIKDLAVNMSPMYEPEDDTVVDAIRIHRSEDYFSIRDLPVMQYHGERNWPPLWVGQNGAPRLAGEIGRLKDVFVHVLHENRCFLFMEYNGQGYIATLDFDDKLFCPILVASLKKHIGKPIEEIGSLTLLDD